MIGPRTKAILTPNLVGNCPDWDAIRAIADRHGLLVVEDSCDVLDSYLRGTRTGTRSDISVTSFARGHSITAAGNGGMIAVDDPEWFDQTLVRRRWGRRSERYLFGSKQGDDDRFGTLADGTPYDMVFVFEDMGYNFEPSEIGAAYGLVQLDRLAEFNAAAPAELRPPRRGARAPRGQGACAPRTTPEVDTTWMRFPFLLARRHRPHRRCRSSCSSGASRRGWCGPATSCASPGFADIAHRAPDDGLPNADRVMDRGLTLPSHHGLTSDEVGHIAESLVRLPARSLG